MKLVCRLACSLAATVLSVGCALPPLAGPLLGGPATASAGGPARDVLPVRPSLGALFERYRAPIQTNVRDLTIGPKTGTASIYHIHDRLLTGIPLVTLGNESRDMATTEAAQRGGITEIDLIEIERFSVLGVYVKETIIVHGR